MFSLTGMVRLAIATTIIALSQLLTIEKSRVRLAPEGLFENFFLPFFWFFVDGLSI